MHIKIGTRSSRLAVWQAKYIQTLLQQGGVSSELLFIETKGDLVLDRALSKIGSKGIFTQELEDQLRAGSIDIAVHSAKDLPSSLPPDLAIIAFTERELANDVLVSRNKSLSLESGISFRIGTSSTRRVAMLKHTIYRHENIYFPNYWFSPSDEIAKEGKQFLLEHQPVAPHFLMKKPLSCSCSQT